MADTISKILLNVLLFKKAFAFSNRICNLVVGCAYKKCNVILVVKYTTYVHIWTRKTQHTELNHLFTPVYFNPLRGAVRTS